MEQVTHVIINESNHSIIVCGSYGTQRILKFHFVAFYDAVEYCQQRMLPQHIMFIG